MSLMLVVSMLSACGGGGSSSSLKFKYDKGEMEASAREYAESWAETDFAEYIEEYADMGYFDEDTLAQYEAAADLQKELGEFKGLQDGVELIEAEDSVKCTVNADFQNGTAILSFFLDRDYSLVSFTSEKYTTFGEKMQNAGLNTLFGMLFIFTVLVFISFVIRLLAYVPKLLERKKEEPEEAPMPASPAPTPAVAEAPVQSVPVDDGSEIAAVVTAALMAYLSETQVEVPADGLVVRSIRKRGGGWKRAI